MMSLKRAFGEPPPPVTLDIAREVHAGFTAQAKHVLQGSHRQAGHGSEDGANEIPMHFPAIRVQIRTAEGALFDDFLRSSRAVAFPGAGPPPPCRIVIVSSGVSDYSG